ncbi:MAG: hypothetical protein QXU26_03560 [Thermofilaceae archaeon]
MTMITGPVVEPELEAELQVFVVRSNLRIEYRLSERCRIEAFLERGEVRTTDIQTVELVQSDIQRLTKEGREALLWIWAHLGEQVLLLPDQDEEIDKEAIETIEEVLIAYARDLRKKVTEEVRRVYQWLKGWKYRPEELFEHIGRLKQVEMLVRCYGPQPLRDLYQEWESRLRADYEAERQRWIMQYGSGYLRFLVQRDYDFEEQYVRERLAREFPDFTLVRREDYGRFHFRLPSSQDAEIIQRLPQGVLIEDEQGQAYVLLRQVFGYYDAYAPLEAFRR